MKDFKRNGVVIVDGGAIIWFWFGFI